jgi:hypothetical protein
MEVTTEAQMRNSRYNASLYIVAILVLVLACNIRTPTEPAVPVPQVDVMDTPAPSASDETQAPAADLCGNELYPIRNGASWTYTNTGSPTGDFTYTDTITQVRADGFTLTSQFDELTRAQEWACEPQGLKALQFGSGSSASITTQNTTAEFTTLDVTGLSLPKQVTPQTQWQYSLTMQGTTAMPGDQQAQSTGTFSAAMQAMGMETITVPAGTFDAIKIQVKSTVQITAEFQGAQVPLTFNTSSIVWYAPGVGHVKSIENSDFGGTPYTATTELQSYNIP